jgi:uncharacterized protein YjbI with pentapeptide repeats
MAKMSHQQAGGVGAFKLDVQGAFLRRTDLSYANLERANLSRADFTNAILRGANFKDAILNGTILHGADLRNAKNLTVGQLRHAVIDASTQLPEGLDVKDIGSPAKN